MQTTSERILHRMGILRLKQIDLVRATGAGPSTVHAWVSGTNNPTGERLVKLANILEVTPEWLLTGKEITESQTTTKFQNMNYRPPVEGDNLPPSKLTPVISWVQAGDYTPVVSGGLTNVIEWIPFNPQAGTYGFALIVKGISMQPLFNPEDRIYINPTFQLEDLRTGALVVMSCEGDTEATFKELVVEDGDYYLRPLNPDWHKKIIPIDENCRLVGKVVGKYVIYD